MPEINMHTYMSYQYLAAAIVAVSSLLSFLQSFRTNLTSAIKDIFVVLSLVLVDFLYNVGLLKTAGVLVPISLLLVAITVFTWASMVAYFQRKLILWCQGDPDEEKCFLGRLLFFPSQLTHARMFPERYHHAIDYFLVGIPVGLRGRVGALMAIDSDGSDPHAQTTSFRSAAKQLFRKFIWFGIDTSRYLHRGDGNMSLTQKLELFLKEQVCAFRARELRSRSDHSRERIYPIILTRISSAFLSSAGGLKVQFPTGIFTLLPKNSAR